MTYPRRLLMFCERQVKRSSYLRAGQCRENKLGTSWTRVVFGWLAALGAGLILRNCPKRG
jgi:hypothetical protein